MRLSDIDRGIDLEVVRDGEFFDLGFAKRRGHDLLIPLHDPAFAATVYSDANLRCVLTTPECVSAAPSGVGVAVCDSPLDTFFELHMSLVDTPFYAPDFPSEVHPDAHVHPTAYVEEHRVIIGADTVIGPKAVVLAGTTLGKACRIGPGVVLGYEGFEVRTIRGEFICVPHAGGVRLDDGVHVQANACVARALFKEPTTLGENTMVNQLAFVSHGVVTGKRCRIAGCSMVAGSTTIGDDVWVGPGARVSNGLHIGSSAFLSIGSVVTRDVAAGQHVTGNFAVDHKAFIEHLKANFGNRRG